MEIAGERPSIESTSGFSICSRNCRAYADKDSTYRRCPSAKMVSKASDDLPEPETPVMTTNLLRGMTTSMFLRLCSRAPRMTMESMVGRNLTLSTEGRFQGRHSWRRAPSPAERVATSRALLRSARADGGVRPHENFFQCGAAARGGVLPVSAAAGGGATFSDDQRPTTFVFVGVNL